VGDAHVIPDLVKKIRGGQHPVEILGDGKQTRCFTHVDDIARGVVMALDHPAAVNDDFNLGNSEEITMLELARRIYALCRSDRPFEARFVPGFPSDVRRRVPDASKARSILGWQPTHSFDDALREVVGVAQAAA
jgi:nucleoside-diphosphate-sugar epimerase